jgi:predicted permease
VRHLLVEAAPLIVLGSGLGIACGVAVAYALHVSWPGGSPPWGDLDLNGPVLACVLAAFVVVPLLAWLSPVRVVWRRDLRRFMTTGGRATASRGEVTTRQALAVVQVALLLVLLTSAGLLLRGGASGVGGEAELGFDPRDTLTLQVRLPEAQGLGPDGRSVVLERMHDRIAALPGVVDTSLSTPGAWLGLSTTDRVTAFCMECFIGTMPRQLNRGPARVAAVSPGFFAALGAPVLRGRELDPSDGDDAANAAVISRTFAYRLFPNGDPLGKQIQVGGRGGEWYTVVGIVGDIRARGIGSGAEATPALYLSALRHPPSVINLAVRTSDDPMRLLPTVEEAIHALAPQATLAHAMTMGEYLARFRAPLYWFAVLLGVLAGVALLFASSGLQSVMSYNVTRRTREIGIRMALGARIKDVTHMILGQSLHITARGVMLGLFGAIPLARMLQVLLSGVEPFDPLLFGGTAVLLAAAALLASHRHAQRAASVDPQISLRAE